MTGEERPGLRTHLASAVLFAAFQLALFLPLLLSGDVFLSVSPRLAPPWARAGEPPAIDADQVLSHLSGQIDLLLDAGPCRHKESSTVVKIDKGNIEIVRSGAYSQRQLHDLSEIKFLFVCTGNTCRSPMAEAIFRKYFYERCDWVKHH